MNYRWTKEEDDIIVKYYSSYDKEFIISLLPRRTWATIRDRASSTLKIKRDHKFTTLNKIENIYIYEEDILKLLINDKTILLDKNVFDIVKKHHWHLKKTNYCFSVIEGKHTSIHRLITSCPSNMVVDHINHDTLDNRLCNLKVTYQYKNLQNILYAQPNSKSGIRGVSRNYDKRNGNTRWISQVKYKGKYVYQQKFPYTDDGFKLACEYVRYARAYIQENSPEFKIISQEDIPLEIKERINKRLEYFNLSKSNEEINIGDIK